MKIVIWKSHGDIKVYAADTKEQLIALMHTIDSCFDHDRYDIKNLCSRLDKVENHKQAINLFHDLVELINPGYDNDNFESLDLDNLQYPV